MAAEAWSRTEVELTVADYFEMWSAELRGAPYSKAEHRRALQRLLVGRNDSSVERKRSNISAVLIDLGLPYLSGYKPLFNYQHLLVEVVSERLRQEPGLLRQVADDVRSPPPGLSDANPAQVLVDPPTRKRRVRAVWDRRRREAERGAIPRVDYLALEARNARLGLAGEHFVLQFEKQRLVSAGKLSLAERVEHVAVKYGDGAGFDILSFGHDGREQLIEVKTTKYGMYTPFYVSRNEVEVSKVRNSDYRLYRVFGFRAEPRIFILPGALPDACDLDAVQYVGRVA